jgi:hypothetical protein
MPELELAGAAADFIVTCCPTAGAGAYTPDVFSYLDALARAMGPGSESVLFGGRHKEHVAFAVALTARYMSLEPPAAIASVFLSMRFELYFRMLSGRLNDDGSWRDKAARDSAIALLEEPRLKRRRLADVELAYRVMLLSSDNPAVRILGDLEARLEAYYPPDDAKGTEFYYFSIGSRIKCLRDPAAHGYYADLSSEGIFYSLLVGILFYATA